MGIVAFQWGENELTLLQGREKCDPWAIKPAAWDEDEKILRGMPEDNNILKGLPEDMETSGDLTEDMEILSYRTEDKQISSDLVLTEESLGTWFGISKKGRIVFLVDQVLKNGSILWSPVDFLRGEMSPEDYAKKLSEFEPDTAALVYEMIVADINTNSMFHICKKEPEKPNVVSKKVAFGVHTLSSIVGLDSDYPVELRRKELFNDIIRDCKNEQVTPLDLKQMAERFIYDPAEVNRNPKGAKELFPTVSTTALVVKPTKEVMFYERYLENGKWKEHNFLFKME